MLFGAFLLFAHHGKAFAHGLRADALVLSGAPGIARPHIKCIDMRAQPVHQTQPRQAAEQAEAAGEQHQQKQGRAGEAEDMHQRIAQYRAQHAAGCQRQLYRHAVQAHRFQRAAGEQQHGVAKQRQPQGATIKQAVLFLVVRVQIQVAHAYPVQQEGHPPPRGKTENVQQNIGQPGAQYTARILRQHAAGAMRPGRVIAAVAVQDEHEIDRHCHQQQPARLAQ